MANFYNDYEKMLDMRAMSKDEFLDSYSYLTAPEYDLTLYKANLVGGLKSYKISEHILDLIRDQNEMLFRMAISHLMDVGIRHLTLENMEKTCEEIRKNDDTYSIIGNDYMCKIVETATQLARIDHIHLLIYINQHIRYNA